MKFNPRAYEVCVRPVDEGGSVAYMAWFPQFGETINAVAADTKTAIDHAYDNLAECAAWDEEDGNAFPPPTEHQTWASFSGHFSVRVPKAVHEALSIEARRQGVSLNAWVGCLLQQRLAASGNANEKGLVRPATTSHHFAAAQRPVKATRRRHKTSQP